MAHYRTSRILPVVLVIIIIIIAIASLVSLARVVFFSGPATNTAQVDVSRDALLKTTANHHVAMTVRGPIVAEETFRSYTIDISPTARSITSYSGYLNTVIDQTNLGNNVAAYQEFVNALDKANLSKGTQQTDEKNEARGVCATGSVYRFTIYDGTTSVKDLWTSSCNGSKGSLDGSLTQLKNLFVKQIPGADASIKKISL